MPDLQIALIALGILMIVAVIIYNSRQEKSLRTKISHDFIVPKKDVLVDGLDDGQETFQTETFVSESSVSESHQAKVVESLKTTKVDEIVNVVADINEPVDEVIAAEVTIKEVLKSEMVEDEVKVVSQLEVKPDVLSIEEPAIVSSMTQALEITVIAELPKDIHTEVDLIALMTATKPMNGLALLVKKEEILKDLDALVMLQAADLGNNWHHIDASTHQDETFKKVVCSLQLADRRGPVSQAVVHQFQSAMEAIGVEFVAKVDWQDTRDAAKRATDLDKFCIHVDQLVSLHLMQGKTPIHGTKFKGLAEANDMQLHNGKFYCFDDKGKGLVLFTLINADEQPFTAESLRLNIVRGATFQIEVPKLVNCEQTFNRAVLVAQQMANSIGAQMVDDNQRPLGTAQIEKIRQQLKVIHTAMVEREIIPGSTVSQRLFS
jgi:FtsZ-interacting cell division protein ZipA